MNEQQYKAFESRHYNQLQAANVPKHFWRRLFEKLNGEIFDAGDFFQIVEEIDEEGGRCYSVIALQQLRADDPNNIFLIDHAWTFRPQIARKQLREIPGLLDRICNVFNIEERERSVGESHSDYGGSGDEMQSPSMGSGVKHAEGHHNEGMLKSMRLNVSFEKHPENIGESDAAGPSNVADDSLPESAAGSPMFGSLTTLSEEERRINEVLRHMWRYIHTYTMRFTEKFSIIEPVTRDYVDTLILRGRPNWRDVLMHPWHPVDLTGEKLEHIIALDEHFTRGRLPDILPLNAPDVVSGIDLSSGKVRVFGDDNQLFSNLKNIEIERVDRIEDADIIWMRKHFSDYKGLYEKNPKALVNQFPYEGVLTVKDLLAATVQLVHRNSVMDPKTMRWPPLWFQTTFNLETELPQFVAYYQQRALKKMDNTWIVKPWNLARGLDMHVTDDLCYIIRLVESGPKIACKYVHRPVLFRRPDNGNMVKFDLRYIVFLRSLRPMKLLLYKKFWIRFAINEFSLCELDDRETHFTVFNYTDKDKVLNMECDEFVIQLEKLYGIKWSELQSRINEVILDVMETLSKEAPPRGFSPNGQSRAMYGMDMMLKWDSDDFAKRKMCVSFIEGNFMPDIDRACKFYEDFADTAFKALFTDENLPDKLIQLA